MASRRAFTRPRTRMYDCNYNIGESYYKPTLDSLDNKKYGKPPGSDLPAPTAEELAPPERPSRARPMSMGDLESLIEPRSQGKSAAIEEEMDDEMSAMLARIRRAKASNVSGADESFDTTFTNRREEVKKKFAEKMLDAVGINGSLESEANNLRQKTIRAIRATEEEPAYGTKWTALELAPESADEVAAMSRARRSRARLADLENEMEELAERSAARDRRTAGLRQMLADSSSSLSSSDQYAVRKKITTTVTTEKRTY